MSSSDQANVSSRQQVVASATPVMLAAQTKTGGTGGNSNGGKPKLPNMPRTFAALVLALIVLGIYYVGVSGRFSATSAWELTFGLLVVFCLFLGWVISGWPLGILVGSRNLMSLSRFQTVAWTIVILSAFLTIAFRRIIAPSVTAPLDMPMDPHLWALLGISTASLVGTPLILQNKTAKDTDNDTVNKAAVALNENPAVIENNRQGTLYANTNIQDARVTDMFEGDEVGNTAYVDIAKVQMFLFTIIIIVAYCYEVHDALSRLDAHKLLPENLLMPALSAGVVGLLGISHAGYLGSKTADHTPTPQPTNGGGNQG
jgi:hypothetical protein